MANRNLLRHHTYIRLTEGARLASSATRGILDFDAGRNTSLADQPMPYRLPPASTSPLRAVLFASLGGILMSAGCADTRTVLVGTARPALRPDQVQVYLQPPASAYDQIANVYASSRGSFAFGTGAKIDKVVERLKTEAAKVGANGILLHGVDSEASSGVGGAVSTDHGRSPYVSGIGGSLFLHREAGEGVAIYVEPH